MPVVTIVEVVVRGQDEAHGDERGCRGGKDLNINEKQVTFYVKVSLVSTAYPNAFSNGTYGCRRE